MACQQIGLGQAQHTQVVAQLLMIVAKVAEIEIEVVLSHLLHIRERGQRIESRYLLQDGSSLRVKPIKHQTPVVVGCPEDILPIEERGGVVQLSRQTVDHLGRRVGFRPSTLL